MEEKKNGTILSKTTLVPIGFVLTIISAAVGGGIIFEKVRTLEKNVPPIVETLQNVDNRLSKVETQYVQINETLSDIKIEIREINKPVRR